MDKDEHPVTYLLDHVTDGLYVPILEWLGQQGVAMKDPREMIIPDAKLHPSCKVCVGLLTAFMVSSFFGTKTDKGCQLFW